MITLIRHGEAAAKWGDHPDPGLSALGHEQASTVIQALEGQTVSKILTSPKRRCQETAEHLADALSLVAVVEPDFIEVPTPEGIEDRVTWLQGVLAGTWDEAPRVVQAWRETMLSALSNLPDNTVIFTHFVAINAIVTGLEETSHVTSFRPNYCSLTQLQRQPSSSFHIIRKGTEAGTRIL